MNDKLGQEIKIGSIIAYGHALDRCAGIRIGKVLALKEKDRITVMGIDDDWSFQEPKLCERKGTLQFPERIIVLKDNQVPQQYKSLLKDL